MINKEQRTNIIFATEEQSVSKMEFGKGMNLEKFDGTNFKQWKFQIKCALRAKGLDINTPKSKENTLNWDKDDGMAMFILTSAMDLNQIALIENCESALEVMTKLESIYELKSEMSKMMIHERFYQYKMSPSDGIAQHIAKVESLAKQLKESGELISDTAIITKILSTLPQKYRSLRQAWMSLDPQYQTIVNLTARLLDEEATLHVEEEVETALIVAKQSTKNKIAPLMKTTKDFTEKSHRFICYNCGKRGHFAKDCRFPKQSHKQEEKNMLAFNIANTDFENDDENAQWILDSGASAHMSYQRENFVELHEYSGSPLKLGNQEVIEVVGQGNILIDKCVNGQWETSILKNVLYVPKLRRNLLSEGVVTRQGYNIVKKYTGAFIYKDNKMVLCASLQSNNLYELKMKTIQSPMCNIVQKLDLKTWHERLGHLNVNEIMKMCKNNVITGVDLSDIDRFVCEGCAYGKHARLPFRESNRKLEQPGDVVYSDVCGPFSVPSIQGMKYFVIFKDAVTSLTYVYFIKNKCDVLNCFKKYNMMIKNKFSHSVRVLHTDNGGEYTSKDFKDYLDSQGISHELTAPYTPEQNGRAEREIRTILESARSMLYARNVPLNLWAEAVSCAVYLLNRTSSSQTPNITPMEMWSGVKPSLDHVRIFGCEGYVHVPDQKRNKLDCKSHKMMLVGYDHTNYKMYDSTTKRITISRNVIFNEKKSPNFKPNEAQIFIHDDGERNTEVIVDNNTEMNINEQCCGSQKNVEVTGPIERAASDENPESDNSAYTAIDESDETYEPSQQIDFTNISHSNITLRPHPRRNQYFEANLIELDVPMNYDEAINGKEYKLWLKAINEELEAHRINNTWSFVDNKNQRTITSKWVFSVKRNQDGHVEKYKARLCARGFTQIKGLDYNEIFSPTTRYESIRILLSISAEFEWNIRQLDVKTAFLYGELEEDIYMEVPDGVNAPKNKICKLNKSLYGLKQAAHCWNQKFTNFLLKFGFVQSQADNCVFVGNFNCIKVLLILYVDDALILSESDKTLHSIVSYLKQAFDIRELVLNRFVGLEILKTNNSICISQRMYIEQLINKYNMSDAHPCNTPIDVNVQITNNIDNEQISFPYREAIGSLLYLSTATRPDISYGVNLLSRYINNPSIQHVNQLKKIIRYLIKTKNLCIKYQGHESLIAYSDSDFAGDLDTRKSTTGYIFMLNGGPISWISQKQSCIALSTTEAEFMASCEAAKNLLWLKQFFKEIDVSQDCTTLCVDNQSTIKLINNPVYHKKTKHIDVKFHFIREKVKEKLIFIKYVQSSDQLADILTKALPVLKFQHLRDEILTVM